MKRETLTLHRQKGAVMILVGIAGAVLIGFLGLVIDLGRLFVTKTELQSGMDACSLAAAAELRPGVNPPDVDAINRAVSAGITAGNRNNVGFQAAAAGITAADIRFSDRLSDNSTTFPFGYVSSGAANAATARYAMCARSQGGISTWFMQVLEGFLGIPSTPKSVGAWAVATLQPAQLNCAIPLGLCKKPSGTPADPTAGFVVGQWATSKLAASATGSFDWIDFSPPSGGASELADLIKGQGQCSLPPAGTPVGEQGTITSLNMAWNTRFGLYKGSENLTTAPPDYTGYAYTPTSWPSKLNAFSGTDGATPNFQSARATHMPFQGEAASGVKLPGGTQNSTATDLAASGADRRLVTMPIVDCAAWAASNPQQVPVLGFACVLLLHPIPLDTGTPPDPTKEEVWVEYRGSSNDPASPCSTSGLGGGTAGPLVPVLVH
ncbi:MAG: Tad domain-containing protein [Burkholderiales bacterium]